ncbi:hypothetical protein [Thermodesulfovibrio hydrogeniphilus]
MKKLLFVLFLVFVCILALPIQSFSKTCCSRYVATQANVPYDTESRIYKKIFGFPPEWLHGPVDEVFLDPALGGGPQFLKCHEIRMLELKVPPELERFREYFEINPAQYIEYLFLLSYSVTGTGDPPKGYDVKINLELIDIGHQTTVKSGQRAFSCIPREPLECVRARIKNTKNLAKTFQPLDKLLYDYERIPENLEFELEKEPIMAGETMTIKLKNIRDANGKPSKHWQRILVKAEKGKILNGTPYDEYRIFTVGNGIIEIQYQAPAPCRNDKEKITIYNTCEIRPGQNPIPEREIATKAFDIFCVEGQLIISWDPWHDRMVSTLLNVPRCQYTGKNVKSVPGVISFRLKPTKDNCYYEVVTNEAKPSDFEFEYIPLGEKRCFHFSVLNNSEYRLDKAYVDFRKNHQKPLYFSTSANWKTWIKVHNYPISIPDTQSQGWKPHHGNNLPLIDGYKDDVLPLYNLRIDEKEAKKLLEKCQKKK